MTTVGAVRSPGAKTVVLRVIVMVRSVGLSCWRKRLSLWRSRGGHSQLVPLIAEMMAVAPGVTACNHELPCCKTMRKSKRTHGQDRTQRPR